MIVADVLERTEGDIAHHVHLLCELHGQESQFGLVGLQLHVDFHIAVLEHSVHFLESGDFISGSQSQALNFGQRKVVNQLDTLRSVDLTIRTSVENNYHVVGREPNIKFDSVDAKGQGLLESV